MIHRIQTVLGTAGAVFLGAALLTGSVQAADRPDDRGGMLGVGGVATATADPSGVFERAVARHVGATLPDPLAQKAGSVRPDDRAGVRGPGTVATADVEEAGSGFAWSEAAFGATVAFVLCLALGGLAATMVRQRARAVVR
jgi:hypothetical protein